MLGLNEFLQLVASACALLCPPMGEVLLLPRTNHPGICVLCPQMVWLVPEEGWSRA